MSRMVRVDLLEALKARLLSLPPEQFDWDSWGTNFNLCGTQACVAGWACLMPEFQAAGMIPEWDRQGRLDIMCEVLALDEETGELEITWEDDAFSAVTNLDYAETRWVCFSRPGNDPYDKRIPIRILSRLIKHYKKKQRPHRTWGERKLARTLANIIRMEAKSVRRRYQLPSLHEGGIPGASGVWEDHDSVEAGAGLVAVSA